MGRVSQQTFSVAPWVVSQRIKKRQMGHCMFIARKVIMKRIEETGIFPTLREICEETGQQKCHASVTVKRLIDRGDVPTRAA